jgi:micrococcal nuclease
VLQSKRLEHVYIQIFDRIPTTRTILGEEMMKRVFLLTVFLALTACASPPKTLVPVDTLVAQTMAAMPKTDTPIPTDTLPPATPTQEPTPTPEGAQNVPGAECVPEDTEQLRGLVTRVLDGDTIEIAIGNDSYRVKYIGINAPDILENIEWQGPQAAAANQNLVAGQFVTLVKEVSDTDPSGALLRHVIANNVFVSYELLRQGYAAAQSIPPDTACEGTFLLAQSEAQAVQAGMWAPTPAPTATITPTPTITPIPTATVPGPCDCEGPRLSCNDFANQASAQACFEYCRDTGFGDVFNMDKNENGLACEGLP